MNHSHGKIFNWQRITAALCGCALCAAALAGTERRREAVWQTPSRENIRSSLTIIFITWMTANAIGLALSTIANRQSRSAKRSLTALFWTVIAREYLRKNCSAATPLSVKTRGFPAPTATAHFLHGVMPNSAAKKSAAIIHKRSGSTLPLHPLHCVEIFSAFIMPQACATMRM